jgi:hypothetical protein
VRSPLAETGSFELVDQGHHGARIDPHRRADLLLDRTLSRTKEVQHRKERGSEADGLERRGCLGVRRAPEAKEQLAGELRDLGVGCSGHARGSLHI